MAQSDREMSAQDQSKFHFYLLSLVFTLLALAIQSAKLKVFPCADYFELAGWGLFLVSGLSGLLYMERGPQLRVRFAIRQEMENSLSEFRKLELQGHKSVYVAATKSEQLIAPVIAAREAELATMDTLMDSFHRRQKRVYWLFKYAFVCGLLLVVVSRAYPVFA